jgi:hypothetical protein
MTDGDERSARRRLHLEVRAGRPTPCVKGVRFAPAWQSAIFRGATHARIRLNPAYTVSWLGGEVRLSRDVAVYVRIDNLGNASYESVLGYPALPRSVVAGVRFDIAGGR